MKQNIDLRYPTLDIFEQLGELGYNFHVSGAECENNATAMVIVSGSGISGYYAWQTGKGFLGYVIEHTILSWEAKFGEFELVEPSTAYGFVNNILNHNI